MRTRNSSCLPWLEIHQSRMAARPRCNLGCDRTSEQVSQSTPVKDAIYIETTKDSLHCTGVRIADLLLTLSRRLWAKSHNHKCGCPPRDDGPARLRHSSVGRIGCCYLQYRYLVWATQMGIKQILEKSSTDWAKTGHAPLKRVLI